MTRPDFPRSIIEFQRLFSSEEDCWMYLFKSRWPNGFVCPKCGDTAYYFIRTRGLFRCKRHNHYTSITCDTVMHRSRTPLQIWFWAAYLVTTQSNGISAWQLRKQLGINRYETAFNMLHKLRSAMVRPDKDKIGSIVEVDETYIGGITPGGKRGRGARKSLVIVAVERRGGHAGRIRLRKVPNASEASIKPFIQDSITEGSTIITDAFPSYKSLGEYGYIHRPKVQKETGADSSLPLAHLIISNLKAWLLGTFHGVSSKHLQAYLNEYVFRFNRRKTPLAAFQTVLGLASNVERWPTYEGLYSGAWRHPNPKRQKELFCE